MKILQVVPSYYPAFVYGGPIFSVHYTCEALARHSVDMRVATTNANGTGKLAVDTSAPVVFAPDYRVRYYEDTIIGRFSWAFTTHLWRDIRDADVVHVQDIFSTHASWALLLAWMQRRPAIVSPRGSLASWGLQSKRPLAKKLWLQTLVRPFVADRARLAWHATAESERDEILAQFPGARVFVVPNGLDCTPFDLTEGWPRAAYLERLGRPLEAAEAAVVLVALGRLHEKKAFDVAIRALHAIAADRPGAVLLIAGGDDGDGARLRGLVASLGLEGRVAFVGELKGDDKIAFLKGADLLLFPTHNENFGMVALEALAAGLPVVASREAPWQELEALGSGRWVDNEPESFAAAIGDLLARPVAERRAAARAHASRYSLDAIAEQFKGAYEEMLNASYEGIRLRARKK